MLTRCRFQDALTAGGIISKFLKREEELESREPQPVKASTV